MLDSTESVRTELTSPAALQILSTGAWTYTYSAVEFNRLPPLPMVCI